MWHYFQISLCSATVVNAAHARGLLVRAELRCARADFEEVVKEIDGALTHLEWKTAIIPTPHFTDTDGPLPEKDPGRDVSTCSQNPAAGDQDGPLPGKYPGRDVSPFSQNPAAGDAAPLSEDGGGGHCLEMIEAQKDASEVQRQMRECLQSSLVLESGQNMSADEVLESTLDSTSIWSSINSLPQTGSPRYLLAQDVPPTPEALHCHRDALTMELLWLQQAIDSRKKYLSLKDKLSVS
ncbi:IQ domain-containing protein C isoform X2 [Corythoichthys intestinalis]|uniref:IQ domain-containing protein C isoform X2 n=1 Tax=Corythoichthys intestinalis TaxID=161448 RepID=UPI0025A5BDF2|nr:IQ domain-containing protein C isoform X2 [Corythoichthys intestinalis]